MNRTIVSAAVAAAALALALESAAAPPPAAPDDPYADSLPQRALTRQEKARREALFREGQKLIKQQKWQEASEKLHGALKIQSDPEVLIWRGYAEQQLGKLMRARGLYKLARAEARKEKKAELEARAAQALEALDKVLPRILLKLPHGVEPMVYLDETVVRLMSDGIPVDPGEHDLQVTAQGRKEYRAKVIIRESEAQTIDVALPLLAPPVPVVPPTPTPVGCGCRVAPEGAGGAGLAAAIGLLALILRKKNYIL